MKNRSAFLLRFLLLGMTFSLSQQLFAQTHDNKHAMAIDEWKRWRKVVDIRLSEDGRMVVFAYDKKDKDWTDTTYVFDSKTKKTSICKGVSVSNYEFPDYTKVRRQGRAASNKSEYPSPAHLDLSVIKGVPDNMEVMPISRYINGGKQIYVMLREKSDKEQPVSVKDENKSSVELWKWDEPLSPRRRARLHPRPRQKDKYVYTVADSSWVTLKTEGMTDVFFSNSDSMYGILATDDSPWLKETDWNMHGYNNLYYFNLRGERKLIYEHQN